MLMKPHKPTARRCAGALATIIACAAVLAPGATASSAGTLSAVLKDFQSDGDITACLFTKAQLTSVKSQIAADSDTYSPDFKAEVNREIRRVSAGECSGKALSGHLRIVKAKGRGSASREYVTIKNAGSKRVNLRGYALRDHARKKLRLKTVSLARGRTLRVITGCAKGKHRASHTGSRYYACQKKQFWSDTRDVAELLSPSGKVLARHRTT